MEISAFNIDEKKFSGLEAQVHNLYWRMNYDRTCVWGYKIKKPNMIDDYVLFAMRLGWKYWQTPTHVAFPARLKLIPFANFEPDPPTWSEDLILILPKKKELL